MRFALSLPKLKKAVLDPALLLDEAEAVLAHAGEQLFTGEAAARLGGPTKENPTGICASCAEWTYHDFKLCPQCAWKAFLVHR